MKGKPKPKQSQARSSLSLVGAATAAHKIEILKENEMKLTNHRRPRGRSPPPGQLYLTQADQSVNI
jgi:hypothetical protein